MSDRKEWSFEEDLVACALYAVTEYSKIKEANPQIIEVAGKLNCNPSALVKKLTMYAGLDPVGQAKGHKGYKGSASFQMKSIFALFYQDWQEVMKRAEKIVGPLR